MKKILVLGPGCPNCRKLAADVERAARELGLEYELEKVTDVLRVAEFGVMAPPALVVDGKTLVSGRAPAVAELKSMLAQ